MKNPLIVFTIKYVQAVLNLSPEMVEHPVPLEILFGLDAPDNVLNCPVDFAEVTAIELYPHSKSLDKFTAPLIYLLSWYSLMRRRSINPEILKCALEVKAPKFLDK